MSFPTAGEVKVEVKEGMEEVDFGKITLPEAFTILQASAVCWRSQTMPQLGLELHHGS